MYVVVDTNLFIQCKDLNDLPLKDLFGEDFTLWVPRAVQREIDKFKTESNSRRQKRARKAASVFREVINGNNVGINIELSQIRLDVIPDGLDRQAQDDMIVAEAFYLRSQGKPVRVCTNDTGMILTARALSIEFFEVPEEWLLPPESSPKDKKIAELENRVSLLEKKYPEIIIELEANTIVPNIWHYNQLTHDELGTLVSSFQQRRPQFYLDKEDNRSAIRGVFNLLAEKMNNRNRIIGMSLDLKNTGGSYAENVVIEFEAFGNLYFVSQSRLNKSDSLYIPEPPKSPIDSRPLYAAPFIPSINPPFYRDKNEFYYKETIGHGQVKFYSLECDEFRHLVEATNFEVVTFLDGDNLADNYSFKVRATAKNLPKPVETHIQIRPTKILGDTLKAGLFLIENPRTDINTKIEIPKE
jgi:hypothetical protein